MRFKIYAIAGGELEHKHCTSFDFDTCFTSCMRSWSWFVGNVCSFHRHTHTHIHTRHTCTNYHALRCDFYTPYVWAACNFALESRMRALALFFPNSRANHSGFRNGRAASSSRWVIDRLVATRVVDRIGLIGRRSTESCSD